QRRIDVAPGPGGVGLAHRVGGEREIDVLLAQSELRTVIRLGERDAVDADLDFDDLADAIGLAERIFGLLDATAGIGDVGIFPAHAFAEALEPGAGTDRFNHRRLTAAALVDASFGD